MEGVPKLSKAELSGEKIKSPEHLVAEAHALYESLQVYNGKTLSGKEAERAEVIAKELNDILAQLPYLEKVKAGLPYHPTDLLKEAANSPSSLYAVAV